MSTLIGSLPINDYDEKWFGQQMFGEVVEFVSGSLEPDQVFTEEILLEWAKQYSPEDVFDGAKLETWAEDNGYVLGD